MEADTAKFKPAPGLQVRDPVSMQLLHEDGETKPYNTFWRRREMDGDVVRVDDDTKADEA